MHVNFHSDLASLTPLATAWNDLADGVPFRSWEWLETWWRHYGCLEDGRPKRDHQLFVLTVWDDDNRLIAIAPWYRQAHAQRRTGHQILGRRRSLQRLPNGIVQTWTRHPGGRCARRLALGT